MALFYHSTDLTSSVCILSEGFGRSFGAGSDALLNAYDLPIGGTYLTRHFATALKTYPCHMEVAEDYRDSGVTAPQKYRTRPSGASLMDRIGTLPIKPVFRILAFKSDSAWHRDANQVQFMPKSLYFSHILVQLSSTVFK